MNQALITRRRMDYGYKKTMKKRKLPKLISAILFCLAASFLITIYTATNVHIVINPTYDEGDDLFNYFPIQVHSDEEKQANRKSISSLLKRTSGRIWKVPHWKEYTSTYAQKDVNDTIKSIVRWANFTSTTGKTRPMAIHPHFDFISRAINKKHRWEDCDVLPSLWNNQNNSDGVYVEIGANIGSCVMEMLLSTNANIIAFEPHPKNQLCLKETISNLEPELQNRVILVPVALGETSSTSTIYSAFNNMGNSVVGKIIKDYSSQKFESHQQFIIPIERLDSILQNTVNISLMKLDAQGYECRILEGMGHEIAHNIETLKFEYARKWIVAQNCTDFFPRLRNFGFDIYRGSKIVKEDEIDVALVDLIAKQVVIKI